MTGATPYYQDARTTLYAGDARAVLPTFPAQALDAVVTDPPYELGFMGRAWDRSGIANDVDLWRAVLRVLKPGAHLLAFGGTRTAHRMVCAIEDAGFEIRDTLCWLYGQGFPKSLDVGKALDKAAGAEREVVGQRSTVPERPITGQWQLSAQDKASVGFGAGHGSVVDVTTPATALACQWDGWGTALKPAHEPIVLARAPISEPTVAANVARWGTGALHIDGARLGAADTTRPLGKRMDGGHYGDHAASGQVAVGRSGGSTAGRWPPNVALSHTLFCEPVGTRLLPASGGIGKRGALGQNGIYGQGVATPGFNYAAPDGTEEVEAWACATGCPVALLDAQAGGRRSSGVYSPVDHGPNRIPKVTNFGGSGAPATMYADHGGASRFFYVAKASAAERSRGLPEGERNGHPTVKPLALMRWLLTLVVPPGGVVLDLFAGSGSTLVAATELGLRAVGIEQSASDCATAVARTQGVLR